MVEILISMRLLVLKSMDLKVYNVLCFLGLLLAVAKLLTRKSNHALQCLDCAI
jgi:hypothetical protein